jgi:hypothetical protein
VIARERNAPGRIAQDIHSQTGAGSVVVFRCWSGRCGVKRLNSSF